MQDDNRFFKFLWRFNALLISALGIAGLIIVVFAFGELYQSYVRPHNKHNVVNINDKREKQEAWTFSHAEEVGNRSYVLFPLVSEQNFSLEYNSHKSVRAVRNYLVVDTENNEKEWLLDDNNSLISQVHKLKLDSVPYTEHCKKTECETFALLLKRHKKDTNDNQSLDANDLITLAVTYHDGNNYHEIATDVEQLLHYSLKGKEEPITLLIDGIVHYLTVIYKKESMLHLTRCAYRPSQKSAYGTRKCETEVLTETLEALPSPTMQQAEKEESVEAVDTATKEQEELAKQE